MNKHRGFGQGGAGQADGTRARLRSLAWLLDASIRLPGGFRIGVDALVGLVPFLGDAAGVLMSGYIVSQAAKLGVPRSVLVRMMMNVGIEGVVGMVPLLGDFFDAAWKANLRNVQLLERHLENPRDTARASRRLVAGALALFILFMAVLGILSALFLSWVWHAILG